MAGKFVVPGAQSSKSFDRLNEVPEADDDIDEPALPQKERPWLF